MSDSTPRSGRLITWLLSAALLLLALCPAIYWWLGHQAAIQVSAATGVPRCEGTEPTAAESDTDEFRETGIPMRRGFRCSLAIRVGNHSDRPTTIARITIPDSGPEGGGAFQITHIAGTALREDGNWDAVADLDRPLAPGEEDVIDLHVQFRGEGCASKGMTIWVHGTIEVKSYLASHDLRVTDLPPYFGTADTSCDT